MDIKYLLFFIIQVYFLFFIDSYYATRSFIIDYANNQFLKDGEPFRYISGTMHYFRVPHQYWSDRLKKFKYLGLDTVQTYIAWNFHETFQGKYDFEGDRDIFRFFQLAQENGLNVILRPGPYIDAEWDLGGLPYWILKNETLVSSNKLRTSDEGYLKHVRQWFDYVLPKIKPFLYHNGGPIITVQVENEYGSYFAHDAAYLIALRDQFRRLLGPEIVLFTTDGNAQSFLKHGKIPDVYATIDFGPNSDVNQSFQAQRETEPAGPLINSEYYTGWIDHWGQPHSLTPPEIVAMTLTQMLDSSNGTCVNLYVVEGGTSFAFNNGANFEEPMYLPNPTSYDFDAPLNEGGDPTPKYYAIRDVIGKYRQLPHGAVPTHPRQGKIAYGTLTMFQGMDIMEVMKDKRYNPSAGRKFDHSPTFEEVDQAGGFVFYRHIWTAPTNKTGPNLPIPFSLELPDLRDRAHVFFDGEFKGLLSRMARVYKLEFNETMYKDSHLDILVENQGRICYGSNMNDTKGTGTVYLNGTILKDWTVFPIDLDKIATLLANDTRPVQTLKQTSERPSTKLLSPIAEVNEDDNDNCMPSFFVGHFKIGKKYGPSPNDTYLNLGQWTKGQVLLNGINLGRYWATKGPLTTMYVPGIYIKPFPQNNVIVIFDLKPFPCTFSQLGLDFVKEPIYRPYRSLVMADYNLRRGAFTKSLWISLLNSTSKFIKRYFYPYISILSYFK